MGVLEWLVQIVVGRSGTEMLTNEAGEVTRYPMQSCLFFQVGFISTLCFVGIDVGFVLAPFVVICKACLRGPLGFWKLE